MLQPFSALTDEQLVVLVQNTDSGDAFSNLVSRHQSALLSFLIRFTADPSLADDLSQDALLKAYQNISQFKHKSSFKTWLFSIAYREFLHSKRKASAISRLIDAFKIQVQNSHYVDLDIGLDIQKALKQLGEKERATILLCDGCGMSHSEAAETMGAPLGSVKTYIKRARENLNTILGADYERN